MGEYVVSGQVPLRKCFRCFEYRGPSHKHESLFAPGIGEAADGNIDLTQKLPYSFPRRLVSWTSEYCLRFPSYHIIPIIRLEYDRAYTSSEIWYCYSRSNSWPPELEGAFECSLHSLTDLVPLFRNAQILLEHYLFFSPQPLFFRFPFRPFQS